VTCHTFSHVRGPWLSTSSGCFNRFATNGERTAAASEIRLVWEEVVKELDRFDRDRRRESGLEETASWFAVALDSVDQKCDGHCERDECVRNRSSEKRRDRFERLVPR